VGFLPHVSRPREQGIVDTEAALELFVIVREIVRKSERYREHSRRLRREIKSRSIGSAHNRSHFAESRVGQRVLLEKCVEAAEGTIVR